MTWRTEANTLISTSLEFKSPLKEVISALCPGWSNRFWGKTISPTLSVIERADSSPTVRQNRTSPRSIMIKLLNFQDKVKILHLARAKMKPSSTGQASPSTQTLVLTWRGGVGALTLSNERFVNSTWSTFSVFLLRCVLLLMANSSASATTKKLKLPPCPLQLLQDNVYCRPLRWGWWLRLRLTVASSRLAYSTTVQ